MPILSDTDEGLTPPRSMSESLVDQLVGEVRGQLAALRDPCYGGVQISDEQVRERAAAIVQNFIGNWKVERLS